VKKKDWLRLSSNGKIVRMKQAALNRRHNPNHKPGLNSSQMAQKIRR
jgi:hypothetical protein